MQKRLATSLSTKNALAAGGLAVLILLGVLWQATPSYITAFLNLEKTNPLFDFPGAAPEELRRASAMIREANQSLKALQYAPMYPEAFWSTLARLQERREAFFNYPSWGNALSLYLAEARTLQRYRSDIKKTRNTFALARVEARDFEEAGTKFAFLPGIASDMEATDKAFELIAKNGEKLAEELSKRRSCLWSERQCRTVSQKAERFLEEGSDIGNEEARLLPESYIHATKEILKAEGSETEQYTVSSPCFPNDKNAFYSWNRHWSDATVFSPKLATNTYFRALKTDSRLPEDSLLLGRFSHAWQTETNWYMCPDLDYYPRLATMQYLQKEIQARPLSHITSSLSERLASNLRAAESKLAGGNVAESDVETYISALEETTSGSTDRDWREAAQSRIRVWKSQSGNLASVMARLPMEIALYGKLASLADTAPRPIFPVITRHYASILYAPWNQSVWRLETHPRFTFPDEAKTILADFWSLAESHSQKDIEEIQRLSLEGTWR
ncbi:MAG: hypothetical protein HY471_00215 [Candidatus Sungbacteria bacterium]|nr:hypothetical protein [Candidatus Sungbacteria bacterium]